MSLRLLPVLLSAVVALGGCIFGVSTSGNGAEDTDAAAPEDTEPPPDSGADTGADTAPIDTTADGETADLDSGNLDADGGVDAGRLPCEPGSAPRPRDAGFRDTAGIDTSGDATALFEGPEIIYVTDSGDIGVLFIGRKNLIKRELGVPNKVQALGPSLYFDDDEHREIPYVEQSGESYALKTVELSDSQGFGFLSVDVEYSDSSRIGVADFDDDCRPDLVWADSIQSGDSDPTPAVRRIDANDPATPTIVAEPNTQPWAVMGAIDPQGTGQNTPDGNEDLYWYDTAGEGKFVEDDSNGTVEDAEEKFASVGSSDSSPGVGGPAWLAEFDKTVFPIVDSDNNPARLTAKTPQLVPLDNQGTAVAAPVGTGDVDRDGRPEVVFVGDGGKLQSVSTDFSNDSNSNVRRVEVDGNDIDARAATGVLSGTSRFFRRVDQQ